MASLIVRNLDDDLKARLRRRAAEHGRSMEAEARAILDATLRPKDPDESVGALFVRLFGPDDGVDLAPYLPPRDMGREPPSFD